MSCLHLLIVEDKNTREDRNRFVCGGDPHWYDRPGYILNKLLRYLADNVEIRTTFILEVEIPHVVPSDVDAIVMHVDVSVNQAQIVDWLEHESTKRVVINGFSDLRKSAVDTHRPAEFVSAMLPPDATTGWAFIKSDYNYPQAPEEIHLRVRVEDIEPTMRTRKDLVVQRWIEDFRANQSGLLKTERFTYVLGDLVVGERFSWTPFVGNADTNLYCTFSRPRDVLPQDIRILACAGLSGAEPLPAFYPDDEQVWAARRTVIDHYVRALRFDFAGIDAIEIEPGKFAVIDINPTPFDGGNFTGGIPSLLSYPMLTVMGAHLLTNLNVLIDSKSGKHAPGSAKRGPADCSDPMLARRKHVSRNILETIGDRASIILVDDNIYPLEEVVELGSPVRRFFQGDGDYGSRPSDDSGAVEELESLRSQGAKCVVFVWSAFWWLKYYPGLHEHLRSRYFCVLDNTSAIVFDMRLLKSQV